MTTLHRGPGWVKIRDPGSERNIPDHISESLETIFFGLKIIKFLMRMRIRDPDLFDPGYGIQEGKIRDPR
jgi:hypothetical protein